MPSPLSPPLRVVLVDSALLCLRSLEQIIASDEAFSVVGCAKNGREGLQIIESLRPDVVVCAGELSLLSGAELVAEVMSRFAKPILVAQASIASEATPETISMLAAGAISWANKPAGKDPQMAAQTAEFLTQLRRVSRVSVFTRRRVGNDIQANSSLRVNAVIATVAPRATQLPSVGTSTIAPQITALRARGQLKPEVIAIGASTGGPPILLQLLRDLDPARVPPMLCVQHIAHGFLIEMVEWLRGQCRVELAIAVGGEIARAGVVYFPAEDRHLEISSGGRLSLSAALPLAGHRPAVDVMFGSVARGYGARALAILLTGMGADGALGLQQIRQSGGTTWAQSPATCVVAGMPGKAIELGAASAVLAPAEMMARLGAISAAER